MIEPRRRHLERAALTLTLCLGLGCTTAMELGERRYREGDRLAALETWRGIRPDHFSYERAQDRIALVQEEFEALVVRYRKRAAYYERRERLAESVLNYRLALKLQPDDRESLEHVQKLVRELEKRRTAVSTRFDEHFAAGDLAAAGEALVELRSLDPFSAELASAERALESARGGRIEKLLARGRRGFTSGDHRSAARAFRQVLALDKENESAQGYLSYIARIRSEERPGMPESTAPLDAALDPEGLDASDAEIRAEGFFQNALASERAGDLYAAIRFDLEALRANPVHRRVRSHLARVRGRLEPQVPDLLRAGREHYQQEDLQAALDQWGKVLLVDPDHEEASEYSARAERLLENLERLRAEPTPGNRR